MAKAAQERFARVGEKAVKRTRNGRIVLLALPWVLGLGGCAIPLDLLNPALPGQFGFSLNGIVPTPGKVVIAFNNETTFPVFFAVTISDDPNATTGFEIASDTVAANSTSSRVLQCPVPVVTFSNGIGTGGGATVGAPVVVQNVAAGTALATTAAPLTFGTDFDCGDVIEMTVTQTGGAFRLTIRVLPGS